ncbi:DNA cytosine methyltransferase [Patescibacteria group bacterium]
MEKNKKPTVIDLFCGAGGLSKGFKQAGFDIILGIDNVPIFLETYGKNHPESEVICGDIRKISVVKIKKIIKRKTGRKTVDVVIGGPPCQGFSMAGRRDPKDPRNSLFKQFLKIIKELKPKCYIMENVPGFLTMKTAKGKFVKDIIDNEFKKIHYNPKPPQILLAADYGVSQIRKRVFFVGTKRKKSFKFPPLPTHTKNPVLSILKPKPKQWVGVGELLLPKSKVDKSFFHSKKMIDGFIKRREKNKEKGNGFGWQILNPKNPSYTISARYWKDGADALVKYADSSVRMLTPLECAKIQSFKNFKFCGSKRDVYTQIGNAVPPLLAKAIANEVKELFS